MRLLAQTVDAVRLFGGNAIWKDVSQRLLDDMCQQRTGAAGHGAILRRCNQTS
jgi:hypothetical protein